MRCGVPTWREQALPVTDPGTPVPAPPRLGLWALIALVVGNMIGSGTYLLPAALAPYGLHSLWGWGLSLSGALLLAWIFARMAQRHPGGGGPHHYVQQVFGDHAAALIAWCYWVSCWAGVAAIALACAGSLSALWPALGGGHSTVGLAIGVILLCTLSHQRDWRTSGALQSVAAVLKLVPLLALGVFGWFWFDPALPAVPNTAADADLDTGLALSAVLATATLTLWAFLGLESATVTADAGACPDRRVPLATLIGTTLAGLASVLACTVVLGLVPAATLAHDPAPLSTAAGVILGPSGAVLASGAMGIACLGATHGWLLVQAQVADRAAQRGLFPRWLGGPWTTPERGVARRPLWLGASLAAALVASQLDRHLVGIYTFVVLLSTAACLLPFLAVALALLRTARQGLERWLALLGALFSGAALAGTGQEALAWGAVLVLAGVALWPGLGERVRAAGADG